MDAYSEPPFRKVILEKYINKQQSTNIILDLEKIDSIDSSGIGALVQIAKKLKNQNGNLQIVVNARVKQTLKLLRLQKFFNLQSSLEDALNAIEQSNN